MTEIIKVQVPIFSTAQCGPNHGLVYDLKRKHVNEQPLPDAVIKALGKSVKGYFRGTWSSTVGWAIEPARLLDQGW